MNIEKIMLKDGWTKTETTNAGRIYIEFHKNGLVIELDNIDREEKELRK
jgi:hypothetical protein